MDEQLDRRLVAVMFTDMAGYTALMQADEQRAVEKRGRYMHALEQHHAAAGGTIVQRLGDGSMSMFPSALAAAQAASAIQSELAAADVPVRIGFHVGEVVVEAERLTGDAVNIASRIESFAVAGSVLLSDAARTQLANRPDIDVAALGSFRFKNAAHPVELFALAGDGLVVPDRSALYGKGEAVAAVRTSVPEPNSALLGRERELSELRVLVA